jgi:Domain of Unknown Function (DUF928)
MHPKFLFPKLLVSFNLALVLLVGSSVVLPFESSIAKQKKKSPIFNLPSRGAPGSRVSAGGRSACPEVQKNMTAMLPVENFGYTLKARPSFLIYIPYQSMNRNRLAIELRLGDQKIKKVIMNAPNKTGIVHIPFPTELPSLTENNQYRWILTYTCKTPQGDEEIFVSGAVERLQNSEAQSILQEIKSANFEDKMRLYGEKGIWYDLIAELAQKKISIPNDRNISNLWNDLLNESDVNLSSFSNENIHPIEK